MQPEQLTVLIQKITAAVEKRVADYLTIEDDRKRNEGNSALCIIDPTGVVQGRMFGTDKIRQRHAFRIAWL